jgi:2-polyprenyl-3-methyl-5-hydroxy-6-metoxy-1,4-benzoquinol methylase
MNFQKIIEYLFLFKKNNKYELEYRKKLSDKNEYNIILEKIKDFAFINEKKYISMIYNDNKRIQIINEIEKYEEKINISDLFLDVGKITLSIEKELNEKPMGEIIEERQINRLSYKDNENNIHELSIIMKSNEILYEYEIEYFTIPNIETKDYKLKIYQPNYFFLFINEFNLDFQFMYNCLFGKNTFIGKKPATFTRKDFDTLINNIYYITEKIDGLHVQCIFYNDKVYILNSLLKSIDTININNINDFIIFDAEYINNNIYLFDVIYNNSNINKLDDKIKIMEKYLLDDRIKLKQFNPIYTDIQNIFQREYPYEIDGIIFMPLDSNLPIYKYKKEDYQTIDFLVEITYEKLTINDFSLIDLKYQYNTNININYYYYEYDDINDKINQYNEKKIQLSPETLQLYYNRLNVIEKILRDYKIQEEIKYSRLDYRFELINKMKNNPKNINNIKQQIKEFDNEMLKYMVDTLNFLDTKLKMYKEKIQNDELENGYYNTLPHFKNPRIPPPEYFELLDWYQRLQKNYSIYTNYLENKPYYNPIWILKCGNNAFDKRLGKREYKPIIFNPERDKSINTIGIIHDIIGDIVYEKYDTDSIIEMRWDYKKNRFAPLRIRNDKTEEYRKGMKQYGNDLMKTVMPLWENIKDSITIGEIWNALHDSIKTKSDMYYQKKETQIEREKDIMINVRNYNNRIKSEYINKVIENKKENQIKILDFGSGRGGDMSKINKNNVYYIGIEKFEDNVKEANERLSNLKNKKANIQYIVQDFTELFNLNETFDIILCNFAIHYAFQNEQSLYNFMKNINVHSNINTTFLVSYIDSNELLFKPLQVLIPNHNTIYNEKQTNTNRILAEGLVETRLNSEDIQSDFYRYEKTFMNGKINIEFPLKYGNEINVYIHSIGHTIPEYIVDTEYLMFRMNDIGFKLTESENFINQKKNETLNNDETQFIRLHRIQIYNKTTTPILYDKEFDKQIFTILPTNISIINNVNNIYYENGVFLDKMFEHLYELDLNSELIIIRILFDKYTPLEQYNLIKETDQYYIVNSHGTNENGYVIVWKYNIFFEYLIEHNKDIVNIISNYQNYDIFQYEQLLFIHSPINKIDTLEILKYINNTNAVILENNIEYIFDNNYVLENKDIIISPNIIINDIKLVYDRLIQLSPDKIIIYGLIDDTITTFINNNTINNILIRQYFEQNSYKLYEYNANFINNNGLLIFHKNINIDPIINIDFKGNISQLHNILFIPIDIIDVSNYHKKLFRHKKTGKIIEAYLKL